jgi:hypothetical protein
MHGVKMKKKDSTKFSSLSCSICFSVVVLFEGRQEKLVFMSFQFSLPLFDRVVGLVWASVWISGQMFRHSDEITVCIVSVVELVTDNYKIIN